MDAEYESLRAATIAEGAGQKQSKASGASLADELRSGRARAG